MDKIHNSYEQSLESMKEKLRKTESDFLKFKDKNDLQKYFEANLSDETRRKVLKDIEYLQKPSNWHYFDPSVVNTLNPSDQAHIHDTFLK